MTPADPVQALLARQWNRVYDAYVNNQLTKVVIDHTRAEGERDPAGVSQAKDTIVSAYGLLEAHVGADDWFGGGEFSLVDCSAAPALFYANIVMPLDSFPRLAAYYRRLLARPSFARVVGEARSYRHLFPLDWPPVYRDGPGRTVHA